MFEGLVAALLALLVSVTGGTPAWNTNDVGNDAFSASGYDTTWEDEAYYDDDWGDDYYAALPDQVKVYDDAILSFIQTIPATPDVFQAAQASVRGVAVNITPATSVTAFSTVADAYDATVSSAVYINVFIDDEFYSFGSGVTIDSAGIIATNYHVVDEAEKIAVTLPDGSTYAATQLLAASVEQDIALLQVDTRGDMLPALPVATQQPRVGEPVLAIGHPENLLFSLSTGVVSGVRDYVSTGEGLQYQVTNPISAGSSGGPIIDMTGALVGIVVSSFEYDQNIAQVQNINFVVPVSSIMALLQ